MDHVVEPAAQPTLPVRGTDQRFPIRRVFCVGRNYADHAVEMGSDPDQEPPFFFTKPADAVFAATEGAPQPQGGIGAAGQVPYPPATQDLHHEIELVVALGSGGTDLTPEQALGHVWGYGVGVDLTRRDLQNEAKSTRRPWDMAKGFDASGPCSELVPASQVGHPGTGRIWISVNGTLRQEGDLANQLWDVAHVIAHLSGLVAVRPGDLIFTGTPSGVAAIEPGDHVIGGIDGIGELEFDVV